MSKIETFTLGYGKRNISFQINRANLLTELKANKVPIKLTGEEEVLRALRNPIGTPRLGDIVQRGESVCIVTSDITRPCPSDILLPPVIAELMDAGVNPEDITVVFALGSHRRHTEEEMRRITGDEVYELVHTIDSDPEDVVLLGYTGLVISRCTILPATAEVRKRSCQVSQTGMRYRPTTE